MSVCQPCTSVAEIPYCSAQVQVGTADPNTSYVVRILNTANGRVDTEVVTSEVDGAIVIDWVNRQEGATYEVSVWPDITFMVEGADDPVSCVSAHFTRFNENYGPDLYVLTTA